MSDRQHRNIHACGALFVLFPTFDQWLLLGRGNLILDQERWASFIVSLAGSDGDLRLVEERRAMHQIIYLVGLIVVIMFILSFLGLR
jgi:hypothetical protein